MNYLLMGFVFRRITNHCLLVLQPVLLNEKCTKIINNTLKGIKILSQITPTQSNTKFKIIHLN